ncbi:MAG: FKBP-type peptidyl-prolyl cis-trans isomerase, partial [Bacteroidales bacterium]|nr:FKBP-type peptidyl-prolyl cis-trans isomerase [Bacteroidales bacterium]
KLIYKEIEENYVAGRRRQMIGLDQAVMQLSHGSRAKIILPSNLAYGIGGDGDRITQSAILVIDAEVL